MEQKVAVIICAAGSGSRFGGKRRKPFVDVAGRAVFIRSIEAFTDLRQVKQILLAIPPEDEELVNIKWGANLKFFGIKVYHGGSERLDTVKQGLELVKDDIDLIAVHDAVRCCVKKQWIEDCIVAAAKTKAAILACPVTATIKKAENKTIIKTIDRNCLYEAQTPQVFSAKLLKEAYSNLDKLDKNTISDDSQLIEALGCKVSIVETDSSNIKITTAGDIAIAEAIIKSHPKPSPKGPAGPYVEAQW